MQDQSGRPRLCWIQKRPSRRQGPRLTVPLDSKRLFAGGYSDHSIPTTTDYETYRFFVDEGLRLGTYNGT